MKPLFRSDFRFKTILVAAAVVLSSPALARGASRRPCDIFKTKTPCVAAFSTTRSLYRNYKGPLYQVMRASDHRRKKIGLLHDGYADAAVQDSFCASTTCTIVRIYDQSPNHNDLTPAPPGGAAQGPGPKGYDDPAIADALPVNVAGHKVYGIAIVPSMGYRNDKAKNTAVRGEPEGVYMVASSLDLNNKCCFDFGNAETNNLDNLAGHMDAINVICDREPCIPYAGLDMENGIFGHLKTPDGAPFVTVLGANDGQRTFAIYVGNAQSRPLTSTGVIPLPNGYRPMKQEGAILLGIGGDNSNRASGHFFEGVMTRGMPSAEAMEAVQANIVAARYTARPHS